MEKQTRVRVFDLKSSCRSDVVAHEPRELGVGFYGLYDGDLGSQGRDEQQREEC